MMHIKTQVTIILVRRFTLFHWSIWFHMVSFRLSTYKTV